MILKATQGITAVRRETTHIAILMPQAIQRMAFIAKSLDQQLMVQGARTASQIIRVISCLPIYILSSDGMIPFRAIPVTLYAE